MMAAELRGYWLNRIWANRACWICGNCGVCGHREPSVEYAYIEAQLRAVVQPSIPETIQ